jgi:hypothetical protein
MRNDGSDREAKGTALEKFGARCPALGKTGTFSCSGQNVGTVRTMRQSMLGPTPASAGRWTGEFCGRGWSSRGSRAGLAILRFTVLIGHLYQGAF